jgi:hypothetical protein
MCFVEWNFLTVMFPGSLAPQGPNFFVKTCLARSSSVYHSGPPLIGVARTTKFNQTSMADTLEGAAGSSDSGHHRS